MADETKEIEVVLKSVGADKLTNQIKDLVNNLGLLNTDIKKINDIIIKQTINQKKQADQIDKTSKQWKAYNKTLDAGIKIKGLAIRKTIELTKSIASLGIGSAVFGATFGGLLNSFSAYAEDVIRSSRVTSLFGQGLSKTQAQIKATAKEIGISEKDIFGLYNEFQRINRVIDVSGSSFANLTGILKSRLGPSIRDIKEGLQTLNQVAEVNRGIYKRALDGYKATSDTAKTHYLILTQIEGVSHDVALRTMEIANGFKMMTDEEKKSLAESQAAVEANQQLQRALQDAALTIQNILAPLLIKMAQLMVPLIDLTANFIDKLSILHPANLGKAIVGGLGEIVGAMGKGTGALIKMATGWEGLEKGSDKWIAFLDDWVYEGKEVSNIAEEMGDSLKDLEDQLFGGKKAGTKQILDKKMAEIELKEREGMIYEFYKKDNNIKIKNEKHEKEIHEKFLTEKGQFEKKKAEEIADYITGIRESQEKRKAAKRFIEEFSGQKQMMDAMVKGSEALIGKTEQQISSQAKLTGTVSNLDQKIGNINKLYDTQISEINKMVSIVKNDILKANKQSEDYLKNQIKLYGENSKEVKEARKEHQRLTIQSQELTANMERMAAAKTYEKMETVLRNINVDLEEQMKLRESMTDLAETEMELQEKLYFGIGATLQARLKTVQSVQSQIKILEIELANYKKLNAQYKDSPEYQAKVNQMETQRLRLIGKQVDLTKELREGYLSAIEAGEGAAGEFEKIIQRQDFGIRDLIENFETAGAMALGGMGKGLDAPALRFVAGQGMGGALQGRAPGYEWITKQYYGGTTIPGITGIPGTATVATQEQLSAMSELGQSTEEAREMLGISAGGPPPAVGAFTGPTVGMLSKIDMQNAVENGVSNGLKPLLNAIQQQIDMAKQGSPVRLNVNVTPDKTTQFKLDTLNSKQKVLETSTPYF